MKISLIIPVYNVEKYIKECLDSVACQIKKNVEIIIVDDGTKDNSGVICDEYARKYNFIKVIHKENEGVSVARNTALEKAVGEYIMFLDSDDKLSNGIIEKVLNLIKIEEDLYTFGYDEIDENGIEITSKKGMLKEGEYNKQDFLKKYYKNHKNFPWAIWQNVFKRKIVVENNVRFPVGIKAAEDTDFYLTYLKYVEKIKFIEKPIIQYRVNRSGSAMTSLKPQTLLDAFGIYSKYFYGEDKFISKYFAKFYVAAFNMIVRIKKEDRKQVIDAVDSKIVCSVTGFKYTIFKMLYLLVGKENAIGLFIKMKEKWEGVYEKKVS